MSLSGHIRLMLVVNVRREKIMTPKMQEALNLLASGGNMPRKAFHPSTVAALIKSGHVEEVPGDSAWIALVAVKSEDLPQRDPGVPTVPIDDDVIASGVHQAYVDLVKSTVTPKALVTSTVTPKAWIVAAAQTVAEATEWVCRGRVKPTRVSRRRAQRWAMSR